MKMNDAKKVGGTWKRNLLQIPQSVAAKVEAAKHDDLVVACTRKLPLGAVQAGTYAHLGIDWKNEALSFSTVPILPTPLAGKYSKRNIEGREIVRKDLPMEKKIVSFDSPNFGDWSKGSHEVSWTIDTYRRDHEAPRFLRIVVEHLATEQDANGQPVFVFKFHVDAVLRRGTDGFEAELLYALNVLQENVGSVDVYAADATREDYLQTVYVSWELLPPGERDATIAKILSGFKTPSEELRKTIDARYKLLASLKPKAFVRGTSGFQRYFGAQFADDLVVFENLEYGNAIYVMFEDWQALSQQSRLDLLKGDTTKFIRIIHSPGWESRLREAVKNGRPQAAA